MGKAFLETVVFLHGGRQQLTHRESEEHGGGNRIRLSLLQCSSNLQLKKEGHIVKLLPSLPRRTRSDPATLLLGSRGHMYVPA